MIPVNTRSGQNIAVLGLGASGIATAEALAAGGARVSAWDDGGAIRREAAAKGVALADLYAVDWKTFDALVMSPGIPLTHPKPHPLVQRAREAGIPILGDIELLVETCPRATFVGITGTNGKSTTTALLHHLLSGGARAVQAGGNLGPAALSLEPLGPDGIYVLELSSYQLDLIHAARFDIAVLLNISPDHLDRHGGMAGYVAAKARIFRVRPSGGQTAIVSTDDEASARLSQRAEANGWRMIPVTVGRRAARGVSAADGELFADGEPVANLADVETLPGRHNWQNAAAAFAAASALGMAAPDIARRLVSFGGLPHRQELIGRDGPVRFVNDSKATNAEAAARALASYDNIFWIAGGIAKDDGLGAAVAELAHVRAAFLIGEAAADFALALDGTVPVEICDTLDRAVAAAHDAARQCGGDATVLLSPACASFDQFPNFGARGDAFRELVMARLREEAGT